MNDEIVAVITAAISVSLENKVFEIKSISAAIAENKLEENLFIVKPFRKKSLWKNLSKKP